MLKTICLNSIMRLETGEQAINFVNDGAVKRLTTFSF